MEDRGYVCGYIGLHPVLAQPALAESDDAFSHTSVYVLDLHLPLTALHGALSENRRRQLRGWEAQQSRLTDDREALTEFFAGHFQDFMRSRHAGLAYAFSDATLRALCALDNVLLTPHLGFVTKDAYERFYGDTVENVSAFLKGEPVRVLNAG